MNDERLAKIEQEKQNALAQSNNVYNSLLQDNQNLYNIQNEYANNYEQTQNDILDKQLAYNTDLIEKQKEIARQNKETEEKKAKNDYTQFINPYGYRNENLAERGLLKSGVSETSMLGGFNTYQNRLATANKVMQDAFTQYDNEINQARLNNDVQKAQNALNKLQMQIELSQNYYSNKSNISQNQLTNNQTLDNNYYNRYQTEYGNIQSEKEREEQIRQWEAQLAENQRQYNESLAFQKEQAAQDQANWEKEYALSKRKVNSTSNNTYTGTLLKGATDERDNFGNTSASRNNSDYYFKSTTGDDYQPRYVYDTKLSKSGKTLNDLNVNISNVSKSNNIWKGVDEKGNVAYYVWDKDHYINVTKYYK